MPGCKSNCKAYCLTGSHTATTAFQEAGMEVIEIADDLREQTLEVLSKMGASDDKYNLLVLDETSCP